jgi:Mg-chelatase subunit ChlD
MRLRRNINIFTLSFLDAMACGFGASVLLFFMMVKYAAPEQARVEQEESRAEITRIELELREGRELLARLQEALQTTDQQLVETESLANRLELSLKTHTDALKNAEQTAAARAQALAALKAELQDIDKEARALRAQAQEQGDAPRSFVGEGDRQYLTGLRVGGERVMILVDASASMLDETIVNVIRRRNMSDEQKIASTKWQRAMKTTDWLLSQLPLDARYQVYVFNTTARPLLEGTEAKWLEVKDTEQLDQVARALRNVVPDGGTSLQNAFAAVLAFDPKPDNMLLITDGLPTQGDKAPVRKTVTPDARLKLFERASRSLPTGMPVNTILFPMEGDPRSTSAYWQLAQVTNGSLISPARDWP